MRRRLTAIDYYEVYKYSKIASAKTVAKKFDISYGYVVVIKCIFTKVERGEHVPSVYRERHGCVVKAAETFVKKSAALPVEQLTTNKEKQRMTTEDVVNLLEHILEQLRLLNTKIG